MTSPVEEALERLGPPSEVYERHGGTVRRGMALCLFHNDHSPSVSFFEDHNGKPRWKCHGCQLGGDSIDLARLLGERVELGKPARPKPAKSRPNPTSSQRELARELARSETFPFEWEAAKLLGRISRRAAQREVFRNLEYLMAGGSPLRVMELADAIRAYLPTRFGIPSTFVYTREQVELAVEELGR